MSSDLVILGRYATELVSKALIGQGSMGDVYLGIDLETDKRVAIKILKNEVVRRNPGIIERFLREGEALRALDHPNIVKLLAAEEADGQYYIVMGYAGGGSLQDLLDKRPRLPISQALHIGVELADALARAHHIGIIHRDLKPANILLDEDGSVRLTDFGMARMLDRSRLTASDVVVGTVKYICPEACNNKAIDHRADLWALGVVLFEMLAGYSPFAGDNMAATLNAILTQPTPDLQYYRPDVPTELCRLVYSMLQKDVSERLASARQAGATLEMIAAEFQEDPHNQTLPTDTQMRTLPLPTAELAITTPLHSQRSTDQLILLEKVGRFWVQGVLTRSAEQAGLIQLTRQLYNQAVDNPWHDALGESYYHTSGDIQSATIEGIYQAADRALLILGDAGAGKTTTLIALAEQLLQAAGQDRQKPLPVILNLVSWADKRPSIAEWVVAELQAKYQIPRSLGQKWLDANELALLLDGLDELPTEAQPACIHAINHFHLEHGLTGIVVCGRLEAYESQPARLNFSGAVRLNPLTAEQVNSYLESAGDAFTGLRMALQKDEALSEMARSPLMLSVMCLAYEEAGTGTGDLAITIHEPGLVSAESQRQQLFKAYVSRMFQRRVADAHYSNEGTMRWLSWLARKMSAHHQTVFLIEQMQPDWLPPDKWRWAYLCLTRLLAGFGVGLFVSLYRFDFRFVLVDTLFGLVLALVHGFLFSQENGHLPKWARNIGVGLLGGLLTAIIFQLTSTDTAWATSIYWGLLNGIGLGLANGIIFGRSFRDDIRTVESLKWDWRQGLKAAVPALLLAVPLGLLGGKAFDFTGDQQWSLTAEIGLAFALFGGLSGSRLERTSRPNEGIRLSLRNAVVAAGLFGVVMGLLLTLLSGPEFGVRRLIQFGLGAWMGYGGLNVLNHAILRFLFQRRGDIPARFIAFLDHAAGLVFLHKVGGGYIFVHRLLQDYFAEQ